MAEMTYVPVALTEAVTPSKRSAHCWELRVAGVGN
jgi:hypothetical protein